MACPDIYVASFYFPGLADIVRENLPGVNVIEVRTIDKVTMVKDDLELLQEKAEVLFSDLSLLKNCDFNSFQRLEWIQGKGAGVDVILNKVNKERPPNFRVTRISSNDLLVGEHVITYILAIEKNILPVYEDQHKRQWNQFGRGNKRYLQNLNICIIGAGEVGKEIARQCKHFNITVYGITRTEKPESERSELFDFYNTVDNLSNVLPLVDYICCCLPGTPETADLLSGDCLNVCGVKKPIFINVGRGNIINEETLVTAIREKWLGGAVLDVVPREPLPASSPLWTLPNVYISPHVAGYSRDDTHVQRYVDVFVKNFRRYCEGQPLLNEVCFQKGY